MAEIHKTAPLIQEKTVVKKLLISFILLIGLAAGLLLSFFKASQMDYGHHFAFDNELGIPIDSLLIDVGGVQTSVYAGPDNSAGLEGNIDVPKDGYPHKVFITIYEGANSFTLKADSFNCYNCDGNHAYTLQHSGAVYRFLH